MAGWDDASNPRLPEQPRTPDASTAGRAQDEFMAEATDGPISAADATPGVRGTRGAGTVTRRTREWRRVPNDAR